MSARRAERKASPLSEIAGPIARFDHVVSFIRSGCEGEGLSQQLKLTPQ
jgi:hypothetical protein